MDMDANWVEASLCFPTFPRFCGQTFPEAEGQGAGAAVCAGLQRLDGRGVVRGIGRPAHPAVPDPAVGPAARRGTRSAATRRGACERCCFSEQPPNLGLPSVHDRNRYWDPFVAACDETGTVICMHSGSGSKMPSTSADAPPAVGSTLTHELAEQSLADWLFSGLLVRYPDLVITYSEGQIGWIPYILRAGRPDLGAQPRAGTRCGT